MADNTFSLGGIVTPQNGFPIIDAYSNPINQVWNSSTALNNAITINCAGMDTVIVSHVNSGSITGGSTTFEVYDGTSWIPVKSGNIFNYTTASTYTLIGGSAGFQIPVAGFPQFRVRLSTAITGTGTVNIAVINSSAPDTSIVTVGLDPGSATAAFNGGESNYSFVSTGAVQAANIKASAGRVYGVEFFNNSASAVYVRLYNETGAPASTDVANILWRGMIPPLANGGAIQVSWPNGLAFSTGIGVRVSTGIADTDTGALTASTVLGNVRYQ